MIAHMPPYPFIYTRFTLIKFLGKRNFTVTYARVCRRRAHLWYVSSILLRQETVELLQRGLILWLWEIIGHLSTTCAVLRNNDGKNCLQRDNVLQKLSHSLAPPTRQCKKQMQFITKNNQAETRFNRHLNPHVTFTTLNYFNCCKHSIRNWRLLVTIKM